MDSQNSVAFEMVVDPQVPELDPEQVTIFMAGLPHMFGLLKLHTKSVPQLPPIDALGVVPPRHKAKVFRLVQAKRLSALQTLHPGQALEDSKELQTGVPAVQ